MTPTQLTLREQRKRGYELVEVVEHWNPWAKIRQDLFGVGDVLCVSPGVCIVQTTSWSNFAARVRKLVESDALPALQRANVRVEVHGWRKNKSGRWEMKSQELSP